MPASYPDYNTISAEWLIELISDDPVARFAAQELRRTLQRIGTPPLSIVAQADGPRIALRHGPAGDGFVRTAHAQGMTLRGDGPRGLLYAVYDLLEALGCAWVAPGPAGERLPRYDRVTLPTESIARQPALPGRCLIIGHDFFLETAEEWILWAARNRLNTIFIHTIDRRLALGACHLRRWRARRKTLLPLLRERGMLLELGGHGLSTLIPRAAFRSTPQAFRHDGVRRTPDHNLCPSGATTRDLLRRYGAAFFRAYPEAQVYHLWPDDLRAGGWCHCPDCVNLLPSDQALLAANELAAALAEINPTARLAYLAYHDTESPPTRVKPHPNVVLTYAPRPRSYAYGIGDTESVINSYFAAQLHHNLDAFDHRDGTSASEHRLFEYYLDGILFKSALPPLPDVIHADLRWYRDAGVHTVQALMTGDRPWLTAPINAYLFARLAWNLDQDPRAVLAQYAAVRAPRSPSALTRVYTALEAAWRHVLDIAPGEASSQAELPALRDLIYAPPADVLDYMAAPQSLRERRLERLDRGMSLLNEGQPAWEEIIAHAYADAPALETEHTEWELSALAVHFLTLRQRTYVLEGRAAPRERVNAALNDAQAALDALMRWGDANLPTALARSHYRLMRLLFQLHLASLRDRRLFWPWQRLILRIRMYAALAWATARIVGPSIFPGAMRRFGR